MMDNLFGVSEKALELCEERSVLLSRNIVNSSTPNYKARDINFKQLMQHNDLSGKLMLTDPKDIPATNEVAGGSIQYRVPMQKSLDGNTVDEDIERKNFVENAIRYQVNLTFIKNKTDELLKAIR